MRCFEDIVKNVKNTTYITDIPIKEFKDLENLECFVKNMKRNGIGTVLHYETSNFHCGVVVQVYDINTCEVKEWLGDGKNEKTDDKWCDSSFA